MPHDVILPALGMAQDTGVLLAWHKSAGDAVSEGDILFEVETDKTTMEVEASAAGYLVDVTAQAGDEVPVGDVIARIADSPDSAALPTRSAGTDASVAISSATETLPDGQNVIMPTLGMAQDSGLLVNWLKKPGDQVTADDALFEVETDKSVMEVPAGFDGYLAAQLAAAGETIPTGETIAVISADKPESTVQRNYGASVAPASKKDDPPRPAPAPAQSAKASATSPSKKPPSPRTDGRILASPKARRLAMEQGLDLKRLVDAGHPQPFHAKDIETLKTLPAALPAGQGVVSASRRLVAEIAREGFSDFADWAASEAGLDDPKAIMAGMAAASMEEASTVSVEIFGESHIYAAGLRLGAVEATDAAPDLRIRDLRISPITQVESGAEDIPILTLTQVDGGLTITLECAADQLSAGESQALLANFAGRMAEPLRHLL